MHEAADRLGVHYMTVYRYVRLGLLPATKSGGQWQIARTELELFAARDDTVSSPGRRAPYADRYRSRAVASDLKGAWAVCEAALASGHDIGEVYLDVIAPAMESIGEAWASGELSVAEEHRASAVAVRTLGRLAHRFTRPGRAKGTIVIGAPTGDTHSLPVTMAADLMRGHGYDVLDLGADTPVDSFVEMARSADVLRAVLVTVTSPHRASVVRDVVDAVKQALPGSEVYVGGGAAIDAAYAIDVGGDGRFASIEALVEHLESG